MSGQNDGGQLVPGETEAADVDLMPWLHASGMRTRREGSWKSGSIPTYSPRPVLERVTEAAARAAYDAGQRVDTLPAEFDRATLASDGFTRADTAWTVAMTAARVGLRAGAELAFYAEPGGQLVPGETGGLGFVPVLGYSGNGGPASAHAADPRATRDGFAPAICRRGLVVLVDHYDGEAVRAVADAADADGRGREVVGCNMCRAKLEKAAGVLVPAGAAADTLGGMDSAQLVPGEIAVARKAQRLIDLRQIVAEAESRRGELVRAEADALIAYSEAKGAADANEHMIAAYLEELHELERVPGDTLTRDDVRAGDVVKYGALGYNFEGVARDTEDGGIQVNGMGRWYADFISAERPADTWSDPLERIAGDVLIGTGRHALEWRVLDVRRSPEREGMYSADYLVELAAAEPVREPKWVSSERFTRN